MSDSVETLRREIDRIDERIVAALSERFATVGKLQRLKAGLGLPAKDPRREQQILSRVVALAPEAERDTFAAVYERIFGASGGFVETIARGVAVLDGKVLICRAKGGETSYLPGGHIEFGETGAEALRREVKEELGVDATVGKFLGIVENSFLQHGKRHCEINLVYEMELDGAASVAQEEWIEFEWWPVAEIDAAKLLPEAMKRHIAI